MGDNLNLEMLQKLMLDMQAEQKAMRAELATVSETVRAGAATLVSVQRDLRGLNDKFTVLVGAVDHHTHRLDGMNTQLDRIEKKLDLTHA